MDSDLADQLTSLGHRGSSHAVAQLHYASRAAAVPRELFDAAKRGQVMPHSLETGHSAAVARVLIS